MPRLLRLDSSADVTGSRSRALTDVFVAEWLAAGEDREVVVRDLHRDPLPHLVTPAQHWPEAQREADAVPAHLGELQREIIDELCAADAVVIGAPVYNWSMPSTLKAWIDLIHIPGQLAGATQPVAGRPAVIVSAQGTPFDPARDHLAGSLRLVLEAGLGMQVHVVRAAATLAASLDGVDDALAEREFTAAEAEARRIAREI